VPVDSPPKIRLARALQEQFVQNELKHLKLTRPQSKLFTSPFQGNSCRLRNTAASDEGWEKAAELRRLRDGTP